MWTIWFMLDTCFLTWNLKFLWKLDIALVSGCCCKVTSVMSDSVRPHRWQPTRLPHPWDSPGKNTGALINISVTESLMSFPVRQTSHTLSKHEAVCTVWLFWERASQPHSVPCAQTLLYATLPFAEFALLLFAVINHNN